jgi:hypothetical protein
MRLRLTVCAWCIAGCSSLVCQADDRQSDSPAADKAANLISDPSLEAAPAADGLPQGWNGHFATPEGGYHFGIADVGHSGKHSILIDGKGDWAVVRANRVRIEPSKRYRTSGWVKIEGDDRAAADVKFHYYRQDGSYIDQTRVAFINPRTKGWQKISVVDQLEQFPDAAFIETACSLAGNGKAWFDDFYMTAREEKRLAVVNLVANGNMEELAADRPAGWTILAAEGGKSSGVAEEKIKHGGERSLHFSGEGDWIAAGSSQVRLNPELAYRATAFVRAAKGQPVLTIAYFKGGEYLGNVTSEAKAVGEEWTELTVSADPKQYADATHISVGCTASGEIDAWLDDVILVGSKPK